MKKRDLIFSAALCAAMLAGAAEWPVAVNGCDRAEGSAANWQVDDKTGACTITPSAGEKPPADKPVTASRLGTSWTIKQPFPVSTVSTPKNR